MKTPDIIFVSPYESKKFGDDYVGMAWDKPDDSCEHVAYIRRDLVDARILDMKNNLEEMKERIEEDEDMLNSCISSIEEAKENRYAYKETDGDTSYDHEIAWLKSLRNRVGKEFLQPHWKPS